MALNERVRAAGGVVRRVGGNGMEVLLVHRPRYDDWTFPKGKARAGETDEETALREVEEETGLRGRLGAELPSTLYRDTRGRDKRVRYWTMRAESGSFEPHDEVDRLSWLSPAEAGRLLSYERDRAVLAALAPPILVVRHASAGEAGGWEGDDAERPLDERGRRQAEALGDQVAGFEIDRIISSPAERCVQTVGPAARARGLEIELNDDLSDGADPARLRSLLAGLTGVAALVCGHGPALEELFGEMRKAETAVVDVTHGELLELGRLPAP